ncbi:hypothetical protein G7046_g491 [Stylonectria norvegica]|nr:hypothetical protein G7046_g491 [Stylonectria norvegica]
MLQEVRPEVANDHLHSDAAASGAATVPTLPETFQGSQQLDTADPVLEFTLDNCEFDRLVQYQSPPQQARTIEEWDGMTDLSSKIGLLSVNAPNAEPHFFGTSSALAMSRLINSALRRVSQEKKVQGDADQIDPMMTSYDSLLATPCPLPSADGRELLAKSYFDNIHPQYPFLHEPTFRTWERTMVESFTLDDTLTSLPPSIPFFVNMVCKYASTGLNPADLTRSYSEQVYALGRLVLPWNTAYSSEVRV